MTKDEALKLALEALKYPLNQSHENFNVDMAELLAHRAITAIKEALMSGTDGAQPEHDKTDVRCECCGYMTYHREHLGCIRAAKLKEPEQDPLTDEDLELLKRALRFYEGCPDGQYDELVVELIHDRLARRSDIKPLTDEEIILIVADCASSHQHTDIHFARAIEAKLKEKNNV